MKLVIASLEDLLVRSGRKDCETQPFRYSYNGLKLKPDCEANFPAQHPCADIRLLAMSPHWHSDTWPIICTAINLLDGSAAAVQVEEEGDEGDDDGAATGATNCSGSASRRIGKQDDGACAIIMNGLQGVQGLFNLIISVLGLGFSLFLCPFNHHITRYLTMGIEGSMYVLRLETPCTRKVGIRRGERDVECNIDVNTNTEKTRHGRKGSKP